MTLIMGSEKHFLTETEKHVLTLRKFINNLRKEGYREYIEGNKEHNSSTLRKLWQAYRKAEVIHDYLQRVYFAVSAAKPAIISVVENRAGDRHVLSSTLDHRKAFQYYDDSRTIFNASDGILGKYNVSEVEAEQELHRLKEKCEQIAQEKHKYIRMEIHNVQLMKKYHDSRDNVTDTKRSICVNVDDQFTWRKDGRPQMLRKHFTVPPSQIHPDDIRSRVDAYCDSIRNIGERVLLQGSYRTKAPEANLTLCCMAELSEIMTRLQARIRKISEGVLEEVKKYPGFSSAGVANNIAEAKTMRYGTGVVIYSGVQPCRLYLIERMRTQQLQKFCAMGAINVDVPRFSWSTTCMESTNPSQGVTGGWKQAQRFISKKVDAKVRKAVRALKKLDKE